MQLKKILENLDKMPSTVKGLTSGLDDKPKLTVEQKRKLREMVSNYNQLGEVLRQEQKIVDVANTLSEISELAEIYACNESADWFQTETIKRDFKRVKNTSMEFKKIAKECYSNMQQLGALYEDLGQTLSRYYEISDPMMEVNPNPLDIKSQENLPSNGPIQEVSPNTSNLQSQKDLPSGGPTKCQCPAPTNPSIPVNPAGTGEVNLKQEKNTPQGGPAPAQIKEVAPKGWEGTVKAMKKHPEVDNPWKLSAWMKKQGYTHHK